MTIKNKIRLGVNIDHIATIRQARLTSYPSIIEAANLAEKGGADGITIHIREDRRHMQVKDLDNLQQDKPKRYINLEMAMTQEMTDIALKYRPQACCIVPEKREELTTEGGLNVIAQQPLVEQTVDSLENENIEVSLFIDPDIKQIEAAKHCGANVIELHTGEYCQYLPNSEKSKQHLETIKQAVQHAKKIGLKINAGHGLHYTNVQAICAIGNINELNIGHAIVARSLVVGMEKATQEMRLCIDQQKENFLN